VLDGLRREHPRLLATADDFARLKREIATDPALRKEANTIARRAEKILTQSPSRYEIPDGLHLLATSRRVLNRVETLALVYRLTGDKRFAERAWQELDAAAKFPDWNPRHFLDTAEMTRAFATGYDWLYDYWSAEQRTTLRAAMVEKGLRPGLECYRGTSKFGWWVKRAMNWNQVCNGGMVMGALALADEEPAMAEEIVNDARKSLPPAMAAFAPDGACVEGPGYWNYATDYNVALLASLQTALGRDFGLSDQPGFAEAGLFPIYMTGPLDRVFNFADAHEGPLRSPQLFWLARRYHRPEYAAFARRLVLNLPLGLLWHEGSSPGHELPLDKYFRHAEVVSFRSAWNDANAVFVAMHAGDNKANHSHLDLGTFVLDALGHRWALDLGPDDYNLPGYFGKQRWEYYRLRAEGHNTVVIDPGAGPDQDPKAAGKIVRFESAPKQAFAIAELPQQHTRGILLRNRREVVVEDEIRASKPAEVWWFLHTRAEIDLKTNRLVATLMQGKERLVARILSPEGAVFSVKQAEPLPTSPHPVRQADNVGVKELAIRLHNVTETRICVWLVPQRGDEATLPSAPEVKPLSAW